MTTTLEKIVTFFKITPVQQACALGIGIPSCAGGLYGMNGAATGPTEMMLYKIVFGVNLLNFLCNEAAATGMMLRYSRLKKALQKRGFDRRIIDKGPEEWCYRNMAKVTSDEVGCGEETRKYLDQIAQKRNAE